METTATATATTVKKETKEYARQWIEDGKPCCYRYGWGWKGAGARPRSRLRNSLNICMRNNFVNLTKYLCKYLQV